MITMNAIHPRQKESKVNLTVTVDKSVRNAIDDGWKLHNTSKSDYVNEILKYSLGLGGAQ
jgi:hypothetical protein